MASTVSEPPLEVPQWLKSLPLAPEYHPTLAEFEDPISYILKIEKEASKYGICKIVPPLPPPPKKSILSNLNRSLSARNPNSRPTFTTRHQQIGFCPRRPRPVQRPVWQSGENYTVQEFEAKAKQFEKIHLKKTGKKGGFSPLEIEYFFWKASVDKPFTVEYANDMPGSAFVPVNVKKWRETGEGATVGESAWNMRGVSRSNGSLLRFMKDEIPGVTSPMVYIAMLFSWFAWHVEDHDLHSLNYMHMGAAKTWYGVPRDAAFAFQEVIRVHGYGGEVNQLVTFATLGEKTTVMSPEVLIGAGIPCCRLVQNVGEFVVTFPGAYHSGFSHGFNCGEAANIATPEWLRFAKEAAIRRASINFPPMVSHFQLLYDLTQTLCSRVSIGTEPRSSRLKEKRRGEGEMIVKNFFVRSVIENNYLLYELLGQGLSCVVVPRNLSHISISQDFNVGSQRKVKPRLPLSLYGNNKAPEDSIDLLSDDDMLHRNLKASHLTSLHSVNRKPKSMYERDKLASSSVGADQHGSDEMCTSTPLNPKPSCEKESGHGLLDQGLFSCVTCGILSYACAAVIQPRDTAVRYFTSAGCNYFNDWNDVSGEQYTVSNGNENTSETNYNSRAIESSCQDDLYDVPVQSGDYEVNVATEKIDVEEHTGVQKDIPALDLLAFAYGDSSDSDEEHGKTEMPADGEQEEELSRYPHDPLSTSKFLNGDSQLHSLELDGQNEASEKNPHSSTKEVCRNQITACYSRRNSSNRKRRWPDSSDKGKDLQTSTYSFEADMVSVVTEESNCLKSSCSDTGVLSVKVTTGSSKLYDNDLYMERIQSGPATSSMPNSSPVRSNYYQAASFGETTKYSSVDISVKNTSMPLVQRSDEDTLRKHVFCLEHAVEVEKQLQPVGGAIMLLLCHPEYPKVESEAKLLAEELGIDYDWNDIVFKEANKEEQEIIRAALDDEETIPGNGDWAVKLGINLYYSANLSRSPLYTKQMPYNSIIYKAFGCSSLADSPMKDDVGRKAYGKQKKIVVAGKWCGKVWMSNQVHPFLVQRTNGEEDKSIGFQAREVPRLEPSSRPDREAKLSHQFVRVTPSSWSSRKTELSYAQRYTQEEEDDALGLHTRPVPCLKSSSKRHSKLEKNVESSHALRDTEEEEDDIGFHARAVPCLRPHPRPGRKAKLSHQFERVTPSTKWHFKLESTVETCHVQRDAQEEEEEAEEDSIGFYGRASMGLKPSLRPQRKVEAGHQFERVSPSSKRRSKHEKKVDTSHAQRESQENEKEVEDEDEEEGGGEDEDEDSMDFDSRAIPCQKPSSRSQRKAEVSHQSERVKPNSKVKRKVEISRIFDRVMPSFRRTPKLEREVEMSHQFEEPLHKYSSGETTALAREIGQKRKRKLENGATKRPKSPSVDNQIEATEAEDSSESDYLSLGRVLRSRQPKTPMLRRNSAKKDQQCDLNLKEETDGGPSTRLRRRLSKPSVDEKPAIVKKAKEARRAKKAPACSNEDVKDEEAEYQCNVDGCTMGFCTKQELMWHKRNICSVKGCGKKFFSHKYLVQHRRVHLDDRPLKCPWKGCKMTFKWAWARTEHIRVHTGARPYVCREKGCGQTFRFVSDFSRHKRRTGHSVKGST